jgi:toxin FitB
VSGFLLDTNIVSELIRPKPDARVVSWIDSTDEALLFLSVLTLGEIRKGIIKVRDVGRRIPLETWFDSVLSVRFAGRILPIDQSVADRWGRLSGEAAARKEPLPVIDSLLAATALHYDMTLVTRNTKDAARTHVSLFNPWVD